MLPTQALEWLRQMEATRANGTLSDRLSRVADEISALEKDPHDGNSILVWEGALVQWRNTISDAVRCINNATNQLTFHYGEDTQSVGKE